MDVRLLLRKPGVACHVYLLLWYIHLNVRTKTEFLQCDIIFIRTELPHHRAINTTIDRSHHVNENVRFHIYQNDKFLGILSHNPHHIHVNKHIHQN